MSSHSYYDEDSDEEEECRVCRGPAEDGRPLFKPCKCSGSIGLTHQDCLTSWLDVTRGDGKCELCSTKFRFAPQYAEGAPDRLSAREVCFRILRRLAAKWLPRGIRAIFAAGLWLLVLPLLTAHIYHGWMRKVSAISERWTWELAKKDVVSGVVIAIIVVVSFLSLMSFAEFLRFEWVGPDQDGAAAANNPVGGQGGRRRNRNRGNRGGGAVGADGDRIIPPPIEGEVDNIIREDDGFRDSYQLHSDDDFSNVDFSSRSRDSPEFQFGDDLLNDREDAIINHLRGLVENNAGRQEDDDNIPILPIAQPENRAEHRENDELDEEDELEAFMRAQEEQDELDQQFEEDDDDNDELPIMPPRRPVNPPPDARFEPQFEPLDPPFPDIPDADDPDAVDLNVALDELLGFRGPILALIRNLLWLLVFNTAYLGTFAFIPSFGGRGVYIVLSKLRFVHSLAVSIPGVETFLNSIQFTFEELSKQSENMNMVYHPSEIAKIGLGYLGWAWSVFFLNSVIKFATRRREATNATQENDDPLEGLEGDIPLLAQRVIAQRREQLQREENENNDENNAVKKRLIGLVESAAAIAKVVILLFLKMLVLPLSLGVCLDIATLELFQQTWNDRIAYAGKDLFGSVFLHWVVGITFMLLVTVSVLQLREVVHPDILARVIRPQEPQPDLLGNLLQESGSTHSKRILMSLGIYAALLGIHIWIPSRLLLHYNINQYLPIFQPKFRHILMPQIQVPLELFVFHLCMLGFLEKYKNNIGELQHHWLIFMGNILKMTDQMLPRDVNEFVLLGTFPVFAKDASINNFDTSDDDKQAKVIDSLKDDIYPLWNELLSEKDTLKREDLMRSNIARLNQPRTPLKAEGELHRNGKLLLSSYTYIRFPSSAAAPKLFVISSETESNLLPTAIGPYRLKQRKVRKKVFIEVWREVAGKLIPRPPEGWDDLGVGGAERQGRWAWGDEQLSEIENSVATRTPFFDRDISRLSKLCTWAMLLLKMTVLVLISWIAITAAICIGINMPLYVGHYVLGVLRLPPDYVHDPLAFAIGVGFIVPFVMVSAKLSNSSNNGLRGVPALLLRWLRSFKPHQSREKSKTLLFFLVLWFGMCPMLLGFFYRAFFLGLQSSTYGIDIYTDKHALLADWTTGTMLLNLWATACYFRLLTIDFWIKMFTAEGQGNANADANREGANANDPARNAQMQPANTGNDTDSWQGKDGIIGRSVESITAFARGWEWDKLYRKALLQDLSLPIFRHLAALCCVPCATVAFLSQLDVANSSTILRLFIVAAILIDYVSSSKESLQRWFEAAHKIARDDRYLIGEILQNYSPRSVGTS